MKVRNPYAIYVNCDGAMDYDGKNSGGIGFIISFPEKLGIEDISIARGVYVGANIERMEYEALIQAMNEVLSLYERRSEELRSVSQIIFISDRFALNDQERTSAYRIEAWRRNKWKTFEGKAVKNHDLLDQLDKARKKLNAKTRCRINIEYRPRKRNKAADKLAKSAKKDGLPIFTISKIGEKIAPRLFNGAEIKYSKLQQNDILLVHVYRKDPVQDQWEVWGEICDGPNKGEKIKIYTDDSLAAKLKRRNQHKVRIKAVFRHHVTIFKTLG